MTQQQSLTTQQVDNRYQLEQELGRGSFGAVFRTTDRLTGNPVALKQVLHSSDDLAVSGSDSNTYSMRIALAHEFQTLASLRHPHIISVIDYGFNREKMPYFTMTLLDNPQTVLEAGYGQSLDTKIRLWIEMLEALNYLHHRKIIHRDLKPDNALVNAEGRVKVLDFGLAQLQEETSTEPDVAGTLKYMAPEIMGGNRATVHGDLYAAGVIGYELFAGEYPFEYVSITDLLQKIMHTKPDIERMDVPLELGQIVQRLLEKDPAQRYPSAYDVIVAISQATQTPIPPETQAIRDSYLQSASFVGRDEELNQLSTALEQARKGEGSSWIIGGEVGIGKTRLLNELRIRALVNGDLVLRGQGVQGGGVAYQAWREPLRRLVLATDIDDLDAGILRDLIPDIDRLVGRDIPEIVQLEGQDYQQRLQGAITSLFQRQSQPILLIIEDLQWATEDLEVLKLLNAMVKDLPVLIVGSYRADEAPKLPEKLTEMTLLRLMRLSRKNIADLSVSMLGDTGKRQDILDLLQNETEGNVFFLVEVMRALAEEAGRLRNIGQMELPRQVMAGGVQEVLRRRVDQIPDEARQLLQLAALTGRELDTQLLDSLYDGETLEDWLSTCANRAVLEVQDEQWQFTHDKIREVVIGAIEASDLSERHQQIARAMEATYPDMPERAGILARHWREAHNPEKEFHYLQQAGAYEAQLGVLEEAIKHYKRALEILPNVITDETQANSIRGFLLLQTGEAEKFASNYEVATQTLTDALKIWEKLNSSKHIAEVKLELAEVRGWQSNYTEAMTLGIESLTLFQQVGDKVGIARTQNHLGLISARQGDYAQATTYCEASLKISREVDDTATVTNALNNLGLVTASQGDFESASNYLLQTLDMARTTGERRKMATILNNLGGIAGMKQDFDEAHRYFTECVEMGRAIGYQVIVASAVGNLGLIARMRENFDEALKYNDEALEVFRRIGNRQEIANAYVNLGQIWQAKGDSARAKNYYLDAIEEAIDIHATPITLEAIAGLAEIEPNGVTAAEWVGLLHNHEATSSEAKQITERVLSQLEDLLDKDVLESALERGKALKLNTIVEQVLED